MIAPPPALAEWLWDKFGIVTTDLEEEPLMVRLLVILKCDHEVAYGDWGWEEYEPVTLGLAGTMTTKQDDGIHHYVEATRASSADMIAELSAVLLKRRTP